MNFHISQLVTIGLITAAFGWMGTPAHAPAPAPSSLDTWSAVVEIDGMGDRIDYRLTLADCMERLGEYEKSFPEVEVTYCEREAY